ncbi:amidinotransferase [Streptomyces albulus]|nr:dimethylargininase [Streptomyces noursei]MCZ1013288.1 amidinotransferase [Streptomyces noursei]GGX53485.1 amidinotransferase [Streptomyces noursei]
MCEPTFFDVRYSINPWMDPTRPTSTQRGISQWKALHDLLVSLGHTVDLVEPVAGLPDMVYAANAATVVDGRALVARFRHLERADESPAYLNWLQAHGWEPLQATHVNEGEGDFLCAGDVILAGTGFRSEPKSHDEAQEFFGKPVLGLTLTDERFYHLDTALAVLDEGEIMYNPRAFSPQSRGLLAERFPDAILADEADAGVFGLNAVSDGLHVILPEQAKRLPDQLRERGFEPIGVDTTELLKGGGSAKCCTLELRPVRSVRRG